MILVPALCGHCATFQSFILLLNYSYTTVFLGCRSPHIISKACCVQGTLWRRSWLHWPGFWRQQSPLKRIINICSTFAKLSSPLRFWVYLNFHFALLEQDSDAFARMNQPEDPDLEVGVDSPDKSKAISLRRRKKNLDHGEERELPNLGLQKMTQSNQSGGR
jgi:hypothetical protein